MDVISRFLKYVSYDTQSDEESESFPSAEKEKILAALLAQELQEMGLSDAHMDPWGYVYAHLPASAGYESVRPIGLIAHMDTSPDAPGANVSPRIVRYDGGDLPLEAEGIVIDSDSLAPYVGQEVIVTDGTTLLGADDKAGVAEIFSAVAHLIAHPEIPHGPISIAITPDEEVGRGTEHFDIDTFAAPVAYTVDGGALGEIEYENFNGASAHVHFNGFNIHPGAAKNKMKNAILFAHEFISLMPAVEIPAHTEGREGFYHIANIEGCETSADIHMIIRDHDRALFEKRKGCLADMADYMNKKHGEGTVVLDVKDSYYNMKEKIEPHMYLIDDAKAAMEAEGVTPLVIPIRGGTDGAQLSWKGLPCPNLSTGGVNFHSVREFVPVASMEAMVRILVRLVSAK